MGIGGPTWIRTKTPRLEDGNDILFTIGPDMKTCTNCHKLLPLTEFYSQKDRKNGASMCKTCFNQYCVERWVALKKSAIKHLGGSCSACGYSKYYGALEFHHTDPTTKDVDWNKLRLRSWDKIEQELSKCVLLCSNCHREAHAN